LAALAEVIEADGASNDKTTLSVTKENIFLREKPLKRVREIEFMVIEKRLTAYLSR
jgi:hypothetical protein